MKILTLYFTRSGHTKKVAELIHDAVGGDIAPIRTKRTYAKSYAMAIVQGGIEKMNKTHPELMPLPVDPADYDVIFLGTPVWWFTIAPAMQSFLADYDLEGKLVCPFLTSGGQPKNSFADFEAACRGGKVAEGFHIYFKGNTMTAAPADIAAWAKDLAGEDA